jgi:hypothetical protein
MRLAGIVFRIAAVWGTVILVPFYFLFVGGPGPSDALFNYPQAYFGFLGVTIAWQIAFWIIGSSPVRFRPLMVAAIVEKVSYVLSVAVLLAHGAVTPAQAASAVPDCVLGCLFVASYLKTPQD